MSNNPPILSPDGSVYLPITQAAEILGVSAPTLKKWREKGQPYLPHYVIDGKVYYQENDLKSFIEARTYEVTAPHAERAPFAALTDDQFSRVMTIVRSKPQIHRYIARIESQYQTKVTDSFRAFLNWVFNTVADGMWPNDNPHPLFSIAKLDDLNAWALIINTIYDPINFPFTYSRLNLFSAIPHEESTNLSHVAIKADIVTPHTTKTIHSMNISLTLALAYANTLNAQNFAKEEIEKPMAKRGRPTKAGSRRERAKAARLIRETTFAHPLDKN